MTVVRERSAQAQREVWNENSLLGQILLYLYGEDIPTTQWVKDIISLPGWRDD